MKLFTSDDNFHPIKSDTSSTQLNLSPDDIEVDAENQLVKANIFNEAQLQNISLKEAIESIQNLDIE